MWFLRHIHDISIKLFRKIISLHGQNPEHKGHQSWVMHPLVGSCTKELHFYPQRRRKLYKDFNQEWVVVMMWLDLHSEKQNVCKKFRVRGRSGWHCVCVCVHTCALTESVWVIIFSVIYPFACIYLSVYLFFLQHHYKFWTVGMMPYLTLYFQCLALVWHSASSQCL